VTSGNETVDKMWCILYCSSYQAALWLLNSSLREHFVRRRHVIMSYIASRTTRSQTSRVCQIRLSTSRCWQCGSNIRLNSASRGLSVLVSTKHPDPLTESTVIHAVLNNPPAVSRSVKTTCARRLNGQHIVWQFVAKYTENNRPTI